MPTATRNIKASLFLGAAITFFLILHPCVGANAQNSVEFIEIQQDINQYNTYGNLPREYKKLPDEVKTEKINWRGFLFTPNLNVAGIYDSNVLANGQNEKSDFVSKVSPGILIEKGYRGHDFRLKLNSSIERFADNQSENNEEYGMSFDAKLMANSRLVLPFSIDYNIFSRARENPTARIQTKERTDIRTLQAETGLIRYFNRLSLSLLGRFKEDKYQNGISPANQPVLYSRNDNRTTSGFMGLEYQILGGNIASRPEASIYANYELGRQHYINTAASQPLNGASDNTRQNFLAGFKTSYKELLFADIGAGMIMRDYEDPRLKDVTDYDLEAKISYLPSKKTALHFMTSRDVEEGGGFIRGRTQTNYALGLDYELAHNWYLSNILRYEHSEFDDIDTIEDYIAALSTQYFLGKSLSSGLELKYQTRQSENTTQEFNRFIMMLNLNKSF